MKKLSKKTIKHLVNLYMDTRDASDMSPVTSQTHVGIEVECFGPCTPDDIYLAALDYGIGDYLQVGDDSSIRPDRSKHKNAPRLNTFEIRLLIPVHRIDFVLPVFGKLTKRLKLKSNKSCGLHVHLDVRTSDFTEVKENLEKHKDMLFAMVNRDRWNNEYCSYFANGKYSAINTSTGLGTIEVRVHHGTTDGREILNWVKLLVMTAYDGQTLPRIWSRTDVTRWPNAKGFRGLKTYIRKTLKPSYFDIAG